MNWNDQDWPKFLLGSGDDDDDDNFYVIHLHHPRFVGKVFPDDDCETGSVEPTFIDDIKHVPAPFISQLTREAEDFFQKEMAEIDEDGDEDEK